MVNLRPTTLGDVHRLEPKHLFLDNPHMEEDLVGALERFDAMTLVTDAGVILAIVGITHIHRHTGEFWAVTSIHCQKYPVLFHKAIQLLINTVEVEYKLKRMQMVVRVGYAQGIKWAERLGFKNEGTLHCFGPEGDDYVMMGRVV